MCTIYFTYIPILYVYVCVCMCVCVYECAYMTYMYNVFLNPTTNSKC